MNYAEREMQTYQVESIEDLPDGALENATHFSVRGDNVFTSNTVFDSADVETVKTRPNVPDEARFVVSAFPENGTEPIYEPQVVECSDDGRLSQLDVVVTNESIQYGMVVSLEELTSLARFTQHVVYGGTCNYNRYFLSSSVSVSASASLIGSRLFSKRLSRASLSSSLDDAFDTMEIPSGISGNPAKLRIRKALIAQSGDQNPLDRTRLAFQLVPTLFILGLSTLGFDRIPTFDQRLKHTRKIPRSSQVEYPMLGMSSRLAWYSHRISYSNAVDQNVGGSF